MLERLPRVWWSPGGSAEIWGSEGTYQRVAYERLPSVGRLDGSFAWLVEPAAGLDRMDYEPGVDPKAELARAASTSPAPALPAAFTRFMSDPSLYTRVPTCTWCCFSVGRRWVKAPRLGDARLLRFMNDQQAVLLWYLALGPDGATGSSPRIPSGRGRRAKRSRIASSRGTWRSAARASKSS